MNVGIRRLIKLHNKIVLYKRSSIPNSLGSGVLSQFVSINSKCFSSVKSYYDNSNFLSNS